MKMKKLNRKNSVCNSVDFNPKIHSLNFCSINYLKHSSVLTNGSLHKQIERKWIAIILLGLLALSLGLILINFNALRFTGFAIEQNISSADMEKLETVVENYKTDSIDLRIKEPINSGLLGLGEAVTKNKNKRMDFNLSGGGLRLYFDLLNYSEFVEGVAESSFNALVNNVTEVIANNESSQILDNSTQIEINENQTSLINDTEYNNQIITNNTDDDDESSEEVAARNSIAENPAGNSSADVSAGITGNAIQRFFGLAGRVIGVETASSNSSEFENNSAEDVVELDINDIKQTAENLEENEIEAIADNSVVSAENFDINISSVPNMTEGKDNYKWGYRVKLNDLKFMAKIEVTTDEQISIYNENTLKIGRNLLSFADLKEAGYKVRIQNPALEIPLNVSVNLNRVMRNITVINETIEEIINKTILNVTEVNQTELNTTEINITEPIINQTEINITIPNRTITNLTEVNATETNFTIINETIANETVNNPIINDSEEKKNQGSEDIAINETKEDKENGDKEEKKQEGEKKDEKEAVEKKDEKEEEKAAKGEKEENKVEENKGVNEEAKEETKEEKTSEKQESKEGERAEEEQAAFGITGNIIKFFRLTGKAIFGMGRVIAGFSGRVIGIDENLSDSQIFALGGKASDDENMNEVSDIKYANTIMVYIERDFSGTNYSIGDIIELDPTLIIIPITDAEHLDENRSFISNIYESVKEKDDNWSEVINNSHYVRATFSQKLGRNNDITVFARVSGWNNESNITGVIEIFRQDGNDIIAKIENITAANWYKTYLDGEHGGIGLSENETSDAFDLKIMNAENVLVNNSVTINGNEVPYDIYQKKKRIDEIKKILFQNFLSLQFLILIFIPKKLKINALLNGGIENG